MPSVGGPDNLFQAWVGPRINWRRRTSPRKRPNPWFRGKKVFSVALQPPTTTDAGPNVITAGLSATLSYFNQCTSGSAGVDADILSITATQSFTGNTLGQTYSYYANGVLNPYLTNQLTLILSALTGQRGAVLNLKAIRLVFLWNRSTTDNLLVGGAPLHPWTNGPFSASALSIAPGEVLIRGGPNSAWNVVGNSNDQLLFSAAGATNPINFVFGLLAY